MDHFKITRRAKRDVLVRLKTKYEDPESIETVSAGLLDKGEVSIHLAEDWSQ